MNTGSKNDRDEVSDKYIIITDKEGARKAMIANRFGGNSKGATIGERRKSKAVHKSGGDDIQMIEDIDSGINTDMKKDMDKASKQLPERSYVPRPTSIRPDFSVPGYRMLNSKSSNEKPPTNPVHSRASSFKTQGQPLQIRSDFSVPGYRMFNSKEEPPPTRSFKESLREVFNRDNDNDDNSNDDSVGSIDDDHDATYEDTCCKNPYLLKRKFALDNVPSSSGATCSSSNIRSNVFSELRFNELRQDRDLSRKQIIKKNQSYEKLQASQQYAYDAILTDEDDSCREASVSDSNDSSTSSKSKLRTMIKNVHIDLKQLAYCPTCNHTLKKSTRRSDKEFRDSVMEMTIKDIVLTTCCGSKASSNSINSKKCPETGGKCTGRVYMDDVYKLRNDFWGDSSIDDYLTTKHRGTKLKELITPFYYENKFHYKVGDTRVCERGFLLLLGVIGGNKIPGKQYERIKNEVMGKIPAKIGDKELRTQQDLRTSISNHAKNYITWIADLNADSCPTDDGKLMLPYAKVNEFHNEYVAFCTAESMPINKYAKIETFRKAFISLGHKYKLIGAKGSFPTCDICNNANNLLRDTKIRDQSHREIIFKFKRIHLLQQMEERNYLERNRMDAKNKQYLGQPTQAFILIDAMTHARGNTPQVGANHRQSKNETSTVISNRVIGVEVVCGPVDEIFYYNTDNLIPSGANTMCQVVLAAIEDLSKRLAQYGKMLPRTLFAQFDNCGENKNKYMFAMFSHLIEMSFFDEIHCNFLLVGHTHCSIDQNFGVLTKKINKQHFIGSPLSFQHLLDIAHEQQSRRPTVNRQLSVIYDFVKYFTPMLNPDIHFIRIPHCFKFSRVMNKAVMRYKMFSTHKIWLPEPPENSILNSADDLLNNLVTDINFGKYVVIGGESELNKDLELENIKLTDSVENTKQSTLFNQLRQVTPRLRELELISIDQQQQRMEYEEQFGGTKDKPISFQSTTAAKKLIEDIMKGTSKDARGYMVWLKAKDGIDDRQPEPLISLDLIEHILKTFSGDDDDADEDLSNNNERKKRQRNDAVKQLLSNIKIIVRTAKSVEHNLTKTHLYSTTSRSDFTYDHKILNQKEVFYYQSRQSVEQVLNIHLQILKELPAHFEWIRLDILSEESRRNIELSKLETKESMDKLIKLATSLLMKENHDKSDGEHIMTGATFDSRPKQRKKAAKSGDTGSSSSAIRCAINECNEVASTVCDFHDTTSNETGKLMKCKEAGVRFCIMHGPAHAQHAHQSFKVSMIEGGVQQRQLQTVIANAKARLEESKAKQKSKKETRKKNIDTLLQNVAEHVEKRTVLTKQSEAKKDKVIAKNNEILNLVNSVIEEANQANSTSSSPIPAVINISSTEVLITEEELEKTHPQIGIKSSSGNPTMAISPQLYNKSKSRNLKSVKVPDLAIELSEKYQLPYRCMLNVFNGINEPQSSFMNTFNHNQYRHWLPDLLEMYDIPLTKIASVFDHTESSLPELESFVREMKEKMKKEKIRTNFLVAVYNHITKAL